MSVRYLGSKARVVESIRDIVGPPGHQDAFFVDAFCGSGVVAEAVARLGWRIRLNDNLFAAATIAAARLISREKAQFRSLGGYSAAVALLNAVPPHPGFVWREYSPASGKFGRHTRRYFTEENAARIDSMRRQIASWAAAHAITDAEERLLIADLLLATNRVANIAGTYGCFLRDWQSQAKASVTLIARDLFPFEVDVEVTVADISKLTTGVNDTVYLDPPYTKRQYAAYYHILETVALGDEPSVDGVTGLRPWREKASEFCYKKKALQALERTLKQVTASRVLLSYSDEGHVELTALKKAIECFGAVEQHELRAIGRYRPNAKASQQGSVVKEFLLVIDKAVAAIAA